MKETGLSCEQATRSLRADPRQRHFLRRSSLPVDEERSRLDRTRTAPALRHTAQLFLKTPNIDQTFCSLSVEVAMPQEPCPLPTVKAPTHKRTAEKTQHRPQGLPAQGPLRNSSVMREGQFQLVQWLL